MSEKGVEGRLPRGIGIERLRDSPARMDPSVRGVGIQSPAIGNFSATKSRASYQKDNRSMPRFTGL